MRILYSVIISLLPICTFAICHQVMIAFPASDSISKNSNIVIEFHGGIIPEMKDFGVHKDIFLKSNHGRIKLIKQAEFNGSEMLQLVFKPETLLKPNEQYSLDAAEAYNHISYLRFYKSPALEKDWIVSNLIDTTPPQVVGNFEFCETQFMILGCGNHTISNFSFHAIDRSEIFIETEIQDLDSGEFNKIFIKSDGKIINVGKSMCAGNFRFRFNIRYKVRFKVYDINGNTNKVWSNWLFCPNPYDS